MRYVLIVLGSVVCGGIIGAVAMVYYIGCGMFRRF